MQLTVIGPKENVERCMASMPIIRLVTVPVKFNDTFMANDGELVKQLQQQHGVQVHFGFVQDSADDLAIVGDAASVDACIKEIQQKMAEMEAENVEDVRFLNEIIF